MTFRTRVRITCAELAAMQAGMVGYADVVGNSENPPKKERQTRSKLEQMTNPYEHDIQRGVVNRLRKALWPGYLVQAVVQERANGTAARRAREAGQEPGWPDLGVWGDGRVWLVEMKDKTGTLERSQKEMQPKIVAAGFPVLSMCRSYEQAEEWLRANGARFRNCAR